MGSAGGGGVVFKSSRLKVSCPISCMERPLEPKGGGGVGEGWSLVTDPCVWVVVPSSKVTKRLCRFVPLLETASLTEVAVMPMESTGLLLEGRGGMDSLLEAAIMLALLSFTSLWPCLALRIVIGIILSPVVSAASEFSLSLCRRQSSKCTQKAKGRRKKKSFVQSSLTGIFLD